jgi:hypothetical protein
MLGSAALLTAGFGLLVLLRLRQELPYRGYGLILVGWLVLLGTWRWACRRYGEIGELQNDHGDSAEWRQALAMMSAWVYQICILEVLTVGTLFFSIWIVARGRAG